MNIDRWEDQTWHLHHNREDVCPECEQERCVCDDTDERYDEAKGER
jgi:hypothetical protein